MVRVRQIEATEWQLIRAVRLAALADAPQAFGETVESERQRCDAEWQRRAKDGAEGQRSFCCLAFVEDEPCGMAVGLPDPEDPDLSYLAAMWVSPVCRGGSVGPKLVDSVIDWARSRGATSLIAGVTPGNGRAQAFYRKIGFEEFSRKPLSHPAALSGGVVLSRSLL